MPFSLSPTFLSSSNLVIQASLALFLTLILSFIKIPVLILQGLYTYVHPDDVNPASPSSHGPRAAIRRPGALDSELRPRKKSKEKFEFDESKAQIFRLKLNDNLLNSRTYFKEFSAALNSTLTAISSMLCHRFLGVSKDSGMLRNGTLIPILLGFVGLCRGFVLFVRISCESSATRKSERQLSFLLGVIGFMLGLAIVFYVIPEWVIDFNFESLDIFGKFCIAVFMGCTVGFLYMPALRNARAFWLGTDQIRCNLPIISSGWFTRVILYSNYMLTGFTALLWISPFAAVLVKNDIAESGGSNLVGSIGHVTELVGNVGSSRSDFCKFRLRCLLIVGLLQVVSLRPNLQLYLNEAVLCWYQRLHGGKVPEFEYSRAKVFLHNHCLCAAVLQFFVPSMMILLFLGLSQTIDDFASGFEGIDSTRPYYLWAQEIGLFLAWWITFAMAALNSAILALYRRGILYVY